MLWTTGGYFVAQVSDLYVVAQYAQAMAEGHPFRYNAGEAPTTRRHEPAAHRGAGARARRRRAAARGSSRSRSCSAPRSTSPRCRSRCASARGSPGRARACSRAASSRSSGPVVWGFLYGSDIALFLFLALLLLERWLALAGGGSPRGFGARGLARWRSRGRRAFRSALGLGLASLRLPLAKRERALALAARRDRRRWCSRCSAR